MKLLLSTALNMFQRLDDAFADPVLAEFDHGTPSEKAKEAAARLLVAIGLGKLIGFHVSEQAAQVSTAIAMGAIDTLLRWTVAVKRQVDELPERCAEASNDVDELCADVLIGRMRLWAVEIALNAVTVNAINRVDPLLDKFTEKADVFSLALSGLDNKIRDKRTLRLLARASTTSMLRDWRRVLASPYCYFLPYWLDGTLERLKEGKT